VRNEFFATTRFQRERDKTDKDDKIDKAVLVMSTGGVDEVETSHEEWDKQLKIKKI